jgi:cytochrome oxidase Cu insertion factor (SCO1/SenC/PrrC family)
MRRLAEAVLTAALALPALAHEAPAPLAFIPPDVGTYELAPIQPSPDGMVLDVAGKARPLSEFTHGRLTLLGLVYTRCADAQGCPRATWAFSEVRALLGADPALRDRVRFVSLSFDPVHDVPQVLARYGARAKAKRDGPEWHFLTAASRAALAPILDGFGQDLGVSADSKAVPGTEEFTHNLKVFLIDPRGEVREIYSTGYLVPRVIVNDMRTLDRERTYAASSATGTQLQKRLRSP